MDPTLYPGEPAAGPWQVTAIDDVIRILVDAAGDPVGRPRIVAIDGAGGSGKTTIAATLAGAMPHAAVVHTDDVAWHHSFFGWTDVLVEGVLEPLRRGETVSCRPAAWARRGRAGAIDVPAGRHTVIVEGTGAARRELVPLLDAVVWVQADLAQAERRCMAREGGTQAARDFWDEWMRQEIPFMADHRPWERANLVVAGTPAVRYDPARQLLTAPPPSRAT
ncbi:hypothetical protein SAMN05444920_118129 [Nonomuraea solani]|uniref:Uridine kinase n=1 Tax=Nonomuraea solani TaxID=1144553 RepID=A0A1H6ESV6_9ACTN|nr:hypothetical protein [Nonomuraea solani]SEH00940.1 hypothetical protein SAMN05444920_118129 [Nonomuraea solani]